MEFKRRRELKRTKIEIIPMIDTIFFLLVFFMLSSLALTRLNGLPVNLPKAASASKQQANDLTVTIDKNKQVYLNKTPVAMSGLGAALLAKAGPQADLNTASVVINADLTVPHGLVVGCIDEARKVGISRFSIATDPEAGNGS
ncbi:MAG: Biopolymer transport protein ExbD/TolR [Capsulimonas sp.]|jgi:biopolymer transport protein ExbD|nr:Biopolymer transport protein ExbD/TolR [Capsulimonas sp.]